MSFNNHTSFILCDPRLGLETASLENEVASVEMCRWLAFVHLWLLCCKGKVARLVRISLLPRYVYNDFISNNGKGKLDPPLLQMNQALYTSLNSCLFHKRCWHPNKWQFWGGTQGRSLCQILQHWAGIWPNFIEEKRMKVIFKTKNSEMFSIPDWKPKCLVSHSPAIEYSAGQEVRVQPERERDPSSISHISPTTFTWVSSLWK